ncbi:MAG: hypothetical protein KatS3mg105_4939 [Gemmatales bacterium]|nr:MAG: hypothetical protein KatS3mg105_4939 [Gemmatales bacterium]
MQNVRLDRTEIKLYRLACRESLLQCVGKVGRAVCQPRRKVRIAWVCRWLFRVNLDGNSTIAGRTPERTADHFLNQVCLVISTTVDVRRQDAKELGVDAQLS